MNPWWWIVGGGAVLGAAAWAVAARSVSPIMSKGQSLWVIGDSLGVGLLPRLVKLGEEAGITVGGNPKGGSMTFQWAKGSMLGPVQEAQVDAILVVLGTNDAAASSAYIYDEFPKYVDSLIAKLKPTRVMWLVPGTSPGLEKTRTDAVANIIYERADVNGFGTLDTNQSGVKYVPKDVHPTPAGYDTLAKWIMSRLTT